MTVIRQEDLIASVAGALQYISYYHPVDYIVALAKAYEREQSPAARDAMAQILINSRMCAEGHRPICQDTGIVNAFVKVGMDVRFEGPAGGGPSLGLQEMVDEGVRRAYLDPDNKLRASLQADPAGTIPRPSWAPSSAPTPPPSPTGSASRTSISLPTRRPSPQR